MSMGFSCNYTFVTRKDDKTMFYSKLSTKILASRLLTANMAILRLIVANISSTVSYMDKMVSVTSCTARKLCQDWK
jgi:hypothetical protein